MAKRKKITRAMKIAAANAPAPITPVDSAIDPLNACVLLIEERDRLRRNRDNFECTCATYELNYCNCWDHVERMEDKLEKVLERLELIPNDVKMKAIDTIAADEAMRALLHTLPKEEDTVDLYDLLPEDKHDWALKEYAKWETETVIPELRKQGYWTDYFWTGDGDSFGPLTRCINVINPERTKVLVLMYG